MFEHLKKFDKILITGPHRAGTRIASKMIASDLGYTFCDEIFYLGEVKNYQFLDAEQMRMELVSFNYLLNHFDKVVIQAPDLCFCIEQFANDNTAIVLMRRDIKDIVASQNRIGWTHGRRELAKYGWSENEGIVSEIEYKHWDEKQKNLIRHHFEIEYESLKEHSLWVDKKDRKNFHQLQTDFTKSPEFNWLSIVKPEERVTI